jgi:hypothetical protein
MEKDHLSLPYWLCFACPQPIKFLGETQFVNHLISQHSGSVSSSQIPFFVSECCCNAPVGILSCPLCPPRLFEEEVDASALLKHVAEHIHSFSLLALPWPSPGLGERSYLNWHGGDDEELEYFAVSSGRGSLDLNQSSGSEERIRDYEREGLPEPEFEDDHATCKNSTIRIPAPGFSDCFIAKLPHFCPGTTLQSHYLAQYPWNPPAHRCHYLVQCP